MNINFNLGYRLFTKRRQSHLIYEFLSSEETRTNVIQSLLNLPYYIK